MKFTLHVMIKEYSEALKQYLEIQNKYDFQIYSGNNNKKIGTDLIKKLSVAPQHVKNSEIEKNFEIEVDYNFALRMKEFKEASDTCITIDEELVKDDIIFDQKTQIIRYDDKRVLELLKEYSYIREIVSEKTALVLEEIKKYQEDKAKEAPGNEVDQSAVKKDGLASKVKSMFSGKVQ
jgi:hypothetical protein